MSLKALNIKFKNLEESFQDIKKALKRSKSITDKQSDLTFDSPKTWRSFMSSQKHEILIVVSSLNVNSVYALAKHLERPSQHVLKDCRELEFCGFLKLLETSSSRRSLRPELVFDYDFIRVEAPVQTLLPVSQKSMRLLDKAASA